MKSSHAIVRWLVLAAAICGLHAPAAQLVTLTVTVTNTPGNGATLVVNGSTRTWTNSVSSPAIQIRTTNSPGAAASNLWSHIASYGFSGPLVLGFSSSNVVTLRGQVDGAIAASSSGSWATLTLTTNVAVTNMLTVRVPAAAESPAVRAFVADELVDTIGRNANTNTFPATAPALANFLNKTGTQTVSGPKTFTGGITASSITATSGALSGVTVTGLVSGAIGIVTNGELRGVVITGATVHATGGTLAGVVVTGATLYATGGALSSVNVSNSTWQGGTITGATVHAVGGNLNGVVLSNATVNATGGTLIGVTISNGMVYAVGGLLSGVTVSNAIVADSTLTNGTFTGTTTAAGEFRWGMTTSTALANGANSGVSPGSGVFLKIAPGPTGNFSVNGIAGGAAGRLLAIYNATGQIMTLANESGTEPTAANRILTLTGGDLTTQGNALIWLLYDAIGSRWVLANQGTLTNAANTNLWTVLGAAVPAGDLTNSTTVRFSVAANKISASVTNVVTTVNGASGAVTVAAASHTHSESDVSGLVSDLAGKASLASTNRFGGVSNVFAGDLHVEGTLRPASVYQSGSISVIQTEGQFIGDYAQLNALQTKEGRIQTNAIPSAWSPGGVLYVFKDGGGKHHLAVKWPDGTTNNIVTQP